MPRQSSWHGQNTLSRHIHRHGTICHVGQRFSRKNPYHATPVGAVARRANQTGAASCKLRNIISFSYNLGWKWFLYENCISRWYLQLSSFKFFNLRTLSCSKNNIKFQHHNSACRIRKIIYFLYGVKWRYFLYQSCSSQWDLQLCSFEFFHLRTLRGSKNNINFGISRK